MDLTLAGWVPTRFAWAPDGPRVQLRDLTGLPLTDPFFDQAVERAVREPYRLLFTQEVTVGELPDLDGPEPAGFVFHCSRCGSTLIAAMLRALDGAMVVSEAPVLDQALRFPAPAAERAGWVRRLLAAIGVGDGRRWFVKWDSWSIHDLPVIRAAFPTVPWVFAYREPGEVLRSQLQVRGVQMVPGVVDPGRLGLAGVDPTTLAPEEYCARVLAAMFAGAADQLDDGGRLVHYEELPWPGIDAVLAHFGVAPTPPERERMAEVTPFEAKNPQAPFDPVRPPVPPAARAAAHAWAAEPYDRLERRRGAPC